MSLFRHKPRTTAERLRELLAENLPRPARRTELQPAVTLRGLGLNSLGLILVVTRFCEEFEIRMESLDTNVGELRTVGDLIAAGERILARREGAPGCGADADG
jgi:acyl carrier protein